MNKSFSFKGMTRGGDALLTKEGECLELVNLRFVNGSLRPIPEFKNEASLPQLYSSIFWHEMAKMYLCVTADSRKGVCFYNENWERVLTDDGAFFDIEQLCGVRAIEFIGFIAVCLTDGGICFIVYDNGSYRWLGERPEIPQLNVSLSSKIHEQTTVVTFASGTDVSEFESSWTCNEKGYLDECISYLNKTGHFIDRVLLRFALRLFDGSYIYCSQVHYIGNENVVDGVGRDADNLLSEVAGNSSGMQYYNVKVSGFKPTYSFSNLNLKAWEGVVVGIDLFASGSIMGKKVDTLMVTLHDENTSVRVKAMTEAYVVKELDELWNDISQTSQFYKIAEFDLNGNCIDFVDDVSQENLLLQPSLNSADIPHSLNTMVAGCYYTVNNRLHVGNLRELFFKGYDASVLKPLLGETKKVNNVVVETKIKTTNTTSIVVKEYGDVELGYKNNHYVLPALLSYPDARAYEMTVLVDTGNERLKKVFPLKPHDMLNLAQYLHKWYLDYKVTVTSQFASGFQPASISPEDVFEIFAQEPGVHEVVYSSSLDSWTYQGREFPPDKYSSLRIFAIPRNVTNGDKIIFTIEYGVADTTFKDINNIAVDSTWTTVDEDFVLVEKIPYEERPNVLKVSMVDNPFFFPAKSTHSPSQGAVVALASNTMPLSQGQFGEHPLYVFCDNGIWVMGIDSSGSMAYTTSFPLSREICKNVDTLCRVDAGVVFLGNEGVMLLNGNKLNCISATMERDEHTAFSYAHSFTFYQMASTFFPLDVIGLVGFMDYMKTARVAYMACSTELLFFNAGFNFCYIYSLAYGTWGKVYGKISGVVNTFPSSKLFVHDSGTTKIMAIPDATAGNNKILLYTRPMLWGTKLPKRVLQLMLHAFLASFDNSLQAPFLGCYLLCSNDCVNFKIVSGCEKNEECNDITFPYFPTQSYKYFALAIVGNVGKDSVITGAELEISFAWKNRLR